MAIMQHPNQVEIKFSYFSSNERECRKCRKIKHLREFGYQLINNIRYYRFECKVCRAERERERFAEKGRAKKVVVDEYDVARKMQSMMNKFFRVSQ